MQATYNDGTKSEWYEYTPDALAERLDDPFAKHVKVRRMTAEVMAGKNKAIQKRRAANKAARKARRK
jgi:hypothetical protein